MRNRLCPIFTRAHPIPLTHIQTKVNVTQVICILFQCKVLVLVAAVLAVGQARHNGEELDSDGKGEGKKTSRHGYEHDGKLTTEEEIEAAKRAKYYFSADVDDGISDLSQHRYEMRNGLDVKGYFSYSDGYQLRKVSYVADSDGYRIIRSVHQLTVMLLYDDLSRRLCI